MRVAGDGLHTSIPSPRSGGFHTISESARELRGVRDLAIGTVQRKPALHIASTEPTRCADRPRSLRGASREGDAPDLRRQCRTKVSVVLVHRNCDGRGRRFSRRQRYTGFVRKPDEGCSMLTEAEVGRVGDTIMAVPGSLGGTRRRPKCPNPLGPPRERGGPSGCYLLFRRQPP